MIFLLVKNQFLISTIHFEFIFNFIFFLEKIIYYLLIVSNADTYSTLYYI